MVLLMSLRLQQSKHGLRVLSFFSTKKNPAISGVMYFSTASFSSKDRLYRQLKGIGVPESRFVAKS